MKKVALALSSGGARGYAHIGVIEALQKAGFDIEAISGSSMGALIGGLFACNKLNEYKEWVLELDALEVITLLDFSLKSGGVIEGNKVFMKLHKMIGNVKIENLPIAYTAVATNLTKKKEEWFQSGSLLDAIRASIAIPTIFTPKRIGNNIYVDGGLLDPLPIAPLLAAKSDYLIAINLNGKNKKLHTIKIPKAKQTQANILKEKLLHYFQSNSISIFEVFGQSIDLMSDAIMQCKLASTQADFIIDIPSNLAGFYEFHKAYELIEYGKKITKHFLEENFIQ